jgi:hypothetical protein
VAIWFKNGRKYIFTPKIDDIFKYKTSWQSWWRELQPQWRHLEDGTYLQVVPESGEEWKALRRGGYNGFFIIVMAFSWWVEAMDGDTDDTEVCSALEDLTWVARCMADMPAISGPLAGGKRAQSDEPYASTKRQRYFIFSHYFSS